MIRISAIFLSLFLISSNAFSFDLGKVLNNPEKALGKSIDGKLDKVVKKLEGKLDGQVSKYKKQIDAEKQKIQKIIAETEASINQIKTIRDKAVSYIKAAKIILAILSSGILILLFFMWRIYRNVASLKKVIKNVTNYDDINKRLKAVESKLAKN
jgi:predicted PurR-regulated permease PerM